MKHVSQKIATAATCLLVSATGSANILHDGGMSGGGGGTTIANPIGASGIESILFSARQSLFLYFNKLSSYPFPTNPKIDAIKNDIQQIIMTTRIYAAADGCQDKFGNDVDGSIYSPKEDSICISLKNLGSKLAVDNAKAQTVALVAHEYAHLMGYDEDDAVFVQNWVLDSYSAMSNAEGREIVENVNRALSKVGSLAYSLSHEQNLTWNKACYLADQMNSAMGEVYSVSETGILSYYNVRMAKGRNSYAAKVIALKEGTCRFSDFYPAKDSYGRDYPEYFKGKTEISDEEFAQADRVVGGPFLQTVKIRKIDTLTNAQAEVSDIVSYITSAQQEANAIADLVQVPLK